MLKVTAYSSTENKEFQKHFNAVKFCIENGLSYPKETSEFFKGKIHGDDLEDVSDECILETLKNGMEVPVNTERDKWGNEIKIKVSEIPAEAVWIIINLS